MSPIMASLALSCAITGLVSWLAYKLFLQKGRLLLRLEELERQRAQLGRASASDGAAGDDASSSRGGPGAAVSEVRGANQRVAGGRVPRRTQQGPYPELETQSQPRPVTRRRDCGVRLHALQVRGPFKGPTGYDHHVREYVRELVNQGVAVELIDLPQWGPTRLPAAARDRWFDSLDTPVDARTVLHFCMPHQVVPDAHRITINHTMFEATRIAPHWVEHHRNHDVIILPTESSRRAWINSGVPEEKIRLCPLGINAALFSRPMHPLALQRDNGEPLAGYRVRFFNVSELGPRKNLVGLLRAWLQATSPRDDAVLMMKMGCYAPGWREEFRRQIELLQQQVGKQLADAAPVHFIHDLFSDADMPRLYAAATHYISMSFGEGWDQAMVEAAASGLKLIAPNHSAYMAYLDPSIAHLIPCREVQAVFAGGGDTGLLFQGANWWEPDEGDAIAAIRAAIDGRDGDTASARERILTEFTWEKATQRLIAIVSEAEARGKQRRFWPLPRGYTRA
jgi:glycosyltransferase involved in cell wall biosynthesis